MTAGAHTGAEPRATSEPLNIFITDPHLKGGGQVRYVSSLAEHLVRAGHRVTVGCKAGSVLVERAAEAGADCDSRLRLRGGLRPRSWTRDLATLRNRFRDDPPDVIHVNGSQDHWVCALVNRSLGRPICLVRTRHNTYPVHDGYTNVVLNRDWTDFQIVVCDEVRLRLAQQKAFDGARMCTIHNGVDADRFRPDPEARRDARAEFGYSDDHVVCGIAARLVPAKGHEFLLRALARIRDRHPGLRLLVLGQGELEEALRRMTRELDIADIVRFAGFRDDMARCTQAFDIGVQPSIDCDTSSFSLKEQMAAAIPVVASDHGGLPEIVTDGVEGRVVPAGTVEPLAQAIDELASDRERRITMGAAGRSRVLRDFTVEVFARRTVEAYRRAIEIHRERAAH